MWGDCVTSFMTHRPFEKRFKPGNVTRAEFNNLHPEFITLGGTQLATYGSAVLTALFMAACIANSSHQSYPELRLKYCRNFPTPLWGALGSCFNAAAASASAVIRTDMASVVQPFETGGNISVIGPLTLDLAPPP